MSQAQFEKSSFKFVSAGEFGKDGTDISKVIASSDFVPIEEAWVAEALFKKAVYQEIQDAEPREQKALSLRY